MLSGSVVVVFSVLVEVLFAGAEGAGLLGVSSMVGEASTVSPTLSGRVWAGVSSSWGVTGQAFQPQQLTIKTDTKPKKKSFFRTQIRFCSTKAR
jgi:hypothetical protein